MARESAAVLHAPLDLRIEEREVPEPSQGELLIEVAAVGICGSDVHYFEHGSIGSNVVRAPHILGHELSGRVVGVGDGADSHLIGDRVAIEPGIACGTCAECAAGRYNLCPQMRFLGAPPVDGALRGHVAVPARQAFPLPETLSDETAALIEPLAVAVWARRRAGELAGTRVLVTGAGPIGLLVAQVAAASGADRVAIVDLNERRLELARALGVDDAWPPDELVAGREGFDVLFECAGSASALATGLGALRPGARVVVVGMAPEGSVKLPLEHLQRRELTVTGSFRYAGCFPEAIELAAGGRVALEPLITARYPLANVAAALRAAQEDPGQVKGVVLPR
jgi:L-iditol 2-dehydrogenase